MTTTSPLVQRAIVATAAAMDCDVDLFGVPVDLAGRAVVFLTAPVRLVVKIDADLARAQHEANAFEALADSVPVPEVWFSQLLAESGHEHWVTGVSFCDGDRLAATERRQSWVDAGAVLGSLHALNPADWPIHPSHPDEVQGWVTKLADDAESSGLLERTAAKAFRQATAFDSQTDRLPTSIHGDLTADYMFHDGSGISGVINMGDSGVGDPAYDLATLTLWSSGQLEAVLEGYGAMTLSPELASDIEQFQLVRLLIGAQWLHDKGFSAAPYLSELYERLLQSHL